MANELPLWEVFIRGQHGTAQRHVGSLHATDAAMAMNNARDVLHKTERRFEHLGGSFE